MRHPAFQPGEPKFLSLATNDKNAVEKYPVLPHNRDLAYSRKKILVVKDPVKSLTAGAETSERTAAWG